MGAITAAQLTVKIGGDSTDAEKSLDNVNSKISKSQGFFGNVLATITGFISAQAILTGVGDAVGFVKDQLVESVQDAIAYQKAQSQLTAGLKSTKDASGETTAGLDALAQKYAALTPFTTTAIEQAEGITLTFTNIGRSVFPQATMAAEDLATRMGESLPAATLQLDKALGNPIKGMSALTREGVVFTAQQQEQIKAMVASGNVMGAQNIMLKEMQKEFGGSAVAAGSTFGGALEILQNRLEDAKIAIGTALLPILDQLMAKLGPVVNEIGVLAGRAAPAFQMLVSYLDQLWQKVSPLIPATAAFAEKLELALSPVGELATHTSQLGDIWTRLQGVLAGLQPPLDQLWAAIQQNVIPAVQVVIPLVEQLASFLAGALLSAIQFLLPIIGTLAGLLINALAGAINVVAAVIRVLIPIIGSIAGWLGTNLTPIVHNVAEAIQQLSSWIGTYLMPVLERMYAFFQANILPVLQVVGSAILTFVVNNLRVLGDILGSVVFPILGKLASMMAGQVGDSFRVLGTGIKAIVGDFGEMFSVIGSIVNALNNLRNAAGSALANVSKVPGLGNLLPHFASGGTMQADGPAVVGEHGQEIVWLPRGSQVMPVGPSAAPVGGSASFGGSGQMASVVLQLNGQTLGRVVTPLVTNQIRTAIGGRVQ